MKSFEIKRTGCAGFAPETTYFVDGSEVDLANISQRTINAHCWFILGPLAKRAEFSQTFGNKSAEVNFDWSDGKGEVSPSKMSTKELGVLISQRLLEVEEAFAAKFPEVCEHFKFTATPNLICISSVEH